MIMCSWESDCRRYVDIPKRKHKDYAIIIRPLDLVWLDIDPNDGCGGIVVPRIPETWAEVHRMVDAITNGKCKVRGYVPREVTTKKKYFF